MPPHDCATRRRGPIPKALSRLCSAPAKTSSRAGGSGGDEPAFLLSEERDRFDGVAALALPSRDAYAATRDKLATIELARELGVPVPRTEMVSTVEEGREAGASLGWPVVVKPRWSSTRVGRSVEHYEVSYAEDSAGLEAELGGLDGRLQVLLQEYCPGEGHGVELLLHRGRPLAAFQHRRLHEVPITGGASSFRESVPLHPTLYDYATRLLAALDWTGLAMVEFKLGEDGPRLMEINGRVWGSLALAIKSGIDFPATDGRPVPDRRARERARAGHVLRGRCPIPQSRPRDALDCLDPSWQGRPAARRRAASPRTRVQAALRLAYPKDGFDVFARDDPRLSLAEIARIAAKLLRKAQS